MQIEILRMQAIQAQQYQAQLLAQSQNPRRPNFNPPATAGPTGSFDLRGATLNAQMRHGAARQNEDQVPMTAALGGKFGVRPMGNISTDYDAPTTTVISGGTSLGGNTPATSKSESASNWRRGGNNNSVLRGANRPAALRTSPPPGERRLSPPPAVTPAANVSKSRPQPLHFNGVAAQPMPAVTIDTSEGENDDADSASSSSESVASNSPPTTPEMSVSPPKDATKANPAALGIGHPTSVGRKAGLRLASQPTRQPRGPPAAPTELGDRNFAARMVAAA